MMLFVVTSLPAAHCSTSLLLRREQLVSLMVRSRVGGTTNAEVDDERRCRRPGSSATSCRSSAK